MRWLSVLCLSLLLSIPEQAAAQATGTITGTVTGAGNRPLAGAAVAVAGTTRGDQTDAQGRFTITAVPAGSRTVRATFAGHSETTRTVTVSAGTTTTLNLTLTPQVVQLEGLVAVGYGTQRREAITGSVSTIAADNANVGMITSPTEMVQGRVS